MIQRIQTVFLFICGIALAALVFFPLLSITPSQAPGLYEDGLLFTSEDLIALVLVVLAALLSLVAIFLYKNLNMQKNLILISILGLFAGALAGAIAFAPATQAIVNSSQARFTLQLGIFMPLLGLICLILAYRYVVKDQKIIKSMDRLR